jgi:hypothetical protein
MKAAVLYSGLPRQILELYDNHKEYIFSGIAHIEQVDVYCYFWDIWGHTNHLGFKRVVNHTNSTLLTKSEKDNIINYINPKVCIFDSFEERSKELSDLINMCRMRREQKGFSIEHGNENSYVFQFYGLQRSFSLLEDNYDLVFRLRSDLKFTSSTPEYYIDSNIHTHHINWWGMNDQMAYGSMDSMKIYSDTLSHIPYSNSFHPETLLHENISKHNIEVHKDFTADYIIQRSY